MAGDSHQAAIRVDGHIGQAAVEFGDALELVERDRICKQALREFLVCGVRYVFAVHTGTSERGIFTAQSVSPMLPRLAARNSTLLAKWRGLIIETEGCAGLAGIEQDKIDR